MAKSLLEQIHKQTETYYQELPARPQGAAVAGWIDHTILKPEATPGQVEQICQEALAYCFAAVCVNPVFVRQVAQALKGLTISACLTRAHRKLIW